MTVHLPDTLEAAMGRCATVSDRVTDLLDGWLSPPIEASVRHHLTNCAGCRHYAEEMRGAVRLVQRLAPEPPSLAIREGLLGVFRAWAAQRRP